jgi:hypothetical protein
MICGCEDIYDQGDIATHNKHSFLFLFVKPFKQRDGDGDGGGGAK